MRREYEMTGAQLDKLYKACQPVPYLIVGGQPPPSQQEMANYAWRALGAELGFDFMTVTPSSKGDRFFTAEASDEGALGGGIEK